MIHRDKGPLGNFARTFFGISLAVLLIVAGVHYGLLLGMDSLGAVPIVRVHVILLYWILVALLLTYLAVKLITKRYEEPARMLLEAVRKASKGDFDIRVPRVHDDGHEDFFDDIIDDVNLMAEELGTIETLKTDFISNVSHEMKTPLAVIHNYSELLQGENVSDEERIEYAEVIEETSGKMTDLITNILRLNRIENQKIVPERKRYDVCRQLCDCVIGFQNKWEDKNLDIELDIEDEAYITADESLMELVWNNLLSNAIKFSDEGGKIFISQKTNDNAVTVSVRDEGCGMSEDEKRHIFDKFYQGDSSHSSEGNGLGLALVWRIIRLEGAEIEVSGEKGRGSCFTVTIPVMQS